MQKDDRRTADRPAVGQVDGQLSASELLHQAILCHSGLAVAFFAKHDPKTAARA